MLQTDLETGCFGLLDSSAKPGDHGFTRGCGPWNDVSAKHVGTLLRETLRGTLRISIVKKRSVCDVL